MKVFPKTEYKNQSEMAKKPTEKAADKKEALKAVDKKKTTKSSAKKKDSKAVDKKKTPKKRRFFDLKPL